MTQNDQTSASTKKISNYITMIVVIVMALAVIALILAASLYYTGTTVTGSTNQATTQPQESCSNRLNRSGNVYIHAFPVKEASRRNEN